jgi:sterol desaturase/sphingolipid hydroxylase (fatty acid hydroxylase superfamily)
MADGLRTRRTIRLVPNTPPESTERRLAELFGDSESRGFGSGWISGVGAAFLGVLAVGGVLCFHFPDLLTLPQLRDALPVPFLRKLLFGVIVAAFLLGIVSVLLRRRKILGTTGMLLATAASLAGGSAVPLPNSLQRRPHVGLDWFLLDVLLAALLFVPLERIAPHRPRQGPFRRGWVTDTTHFFVNHVFVELISLLVLAPASFASRVVAVPALRDAVSSLPLLLQIPLVVLVADLVQYWVHRTFHVVPFLWRFHRIHHSIERMDWLAGSRMHVADVVVTRSLVLVPIAVLGFAQPAVLAYLVIVAFHAVLIHSNFGARLGAVEPFLATPRFHHWHHSSEKEALDRNFAVHLPVLDRLFGTLHMPETRWPERYGLDGESAPDGFVRQLLWPVRRS